MTTPSNYRLNAPGRFATVVVVVPVLGRPGNVRPLLESLRETSPASSKPDDSGIFPTPLDVSVDVLFVANDDDGLELEELEACNAPTAIVSADCRSWAKKINFGASVTTSKWILCGADDLRFHHGWFESIWGIDGIFGLGDLGDVAVIGTNDLGNPATMSGETSTHPIVRRLYAEVLGTVDEPGLVVHEGYHHNFPDTELVATAKKRGVYRHVPRCVVEHLHPLWRKSGDDETYRLGRSRFEQDEALFNARRAKFGF